MLQFSPSDTVKWVEKYGNYSDGDATLSGVFNNPSTTYVGVQGQKTGTGGDASQFSAGDYVLIYQSREGGDGAGNWQLNKIKSIATNTFTFKYANQQDFDTTAQIVKIIKHRNITISGVLDAPAFDGVKGGIIVLMGRSLTVLNGGLITGTGRGYRGGAGIGGSTAQTGEGYSGSAGVISTAPQGNGGGGGAQNGGNASRGGGGGGNATSGTNGHAAAGATEGSGGGTTSTDTFGGGGGGGSRGGGVTGTPGNGKPGGAFILLLFPNIKVLPGGAIRNDGVQGEDGVDEGSGGGGGAGGSIVAKGENVDLGTGTTALGGLGGARGAGGNGTEGGPGGNGRVRVEYAKTIAGVSSPTATTIQSNIFFRRRTPAALIRLAR